ncbi:UDP-2,4-diacetamido-2,4,6-trideoxy-beta-L-altropyranose hydrolase [Phenylobacterium sp.]|jgi:UDP-2,4-diacetamido-2,4,6-trideoxy-beta-L-altropyranose hydrolase|uniref:UDP-2,4-diacetamido-2,4, 6-trideoxy-beta-L-altropyranose hydrolase n=1 Tax=Phenylobacterium sp. TaxID=1871053 RepID=UPI002F941443
MTGPRILFVADAGPKVGGGHVMRSLTLARALEAKGASFAFLAPPAVSALLEAFAPDVARLPAAATDPQALGASMIPQLFDAFVFDHYRLTYADQRGVAGARPTLVIDDLADRPLSADLILDSGIARRATDYEGLHDGARLLLGPAYAPVRPEFAGLRERALARRGLPVQRVLVSMGLTDVGGVTSRVVERLRPKVGDFAFDIVLGAEAPSLSGLTRVARRDPRLQIHVDSQEMARLTLAADIGVGAAGSSLWERCVLGLPSVVVVLAENQRPAAQALAEQGAVLAVDAEADNFDAQMDRALMRLLTDADLRRSLAAASAQVCDGRGAERVADVFLRLVAERTPA